MSKRAVVFAVWTVCSCLAGFQRTSAAGPLAGQIDVSFVPQTQSGQDFSAITLRPDQRIVAASGNRVQQFHPDGSLDTNFTSITFSNSISALALDGSGNIIVGADLYAPTNFVRQRLSRLAPDGSFDRTFEETHQMREIRTIVVHPAGRLI